MGQGLEFVALSAYQLKDIRILLVGHDTAAGGTLFGQVDKGEILTVEQTSVEGEFGQCPGDACHGKSYVALHLTTSHLGVDHIIGHRIESEQSCGHLSVEREGAAIAGSTAQRVAVGHTEGGLQEQHVVG